MSRVHHDFSTSCRTGKLNPVFASLPRVYRQSLSYPGRRTGVSPTRLHDGVCVAARSFSHFAAAFVARAGEPPRLV